MRRRTIVFLAVMAGYLALTAQAPALSGGGGGYLAPSVAYAALDTATSEGQFVERVNALRAQKGLSTLIVHQELVQVARSWAASMAAEDRISHNPRLADLVTADWLKLGENVGVGMNVEVLMEAFIASPTHYKNLVDPSFTHVGVGVVLGRDDVLFTTHQFMTLAPTAPTTQVTAVAKARETLSTIVPRAAAPTTTAKPAEAAPTTAAPADNPVAPAIAAPAAKTTARPTPPPARFVLVLQQLRALDA